MRALHVGVVLVLGLTMSACSGSVLESDEYIELSAEAESLRGELVEAEVRADKAEAAAAEAETALAEAEAELAEAEAELAEAEAELAEAEAELAEPQEWPEEVKTGFIRGCKGNPQAGLSPLQQEQVCTCITDKLEATVSLDDFFVLALSMADPSTPISPLTGLPAGLDDDFARAVIDGGANCVLALE